jgi:hypothetical protein
MSSYGTIKLNESSESCVVACTRVFFSRLNDGVCAFMFCNGRNDSVEMLHAYKQALFSIRQSGGKRKPKKKKKKKNCKMLHWMGEQVGLLK